jgi:hypothetical protein
MRGLIKLSTLLFLGAALASCGGGGSNSEYSGQNTRATIKFSFANPSASSKTRFIHPDTAKYVIHLHEYYYSPYTGNYTNYDVDIPVNGTSATVEVHPGEIDAEVKLYDNSTYDNGNWTGRLVGMTRFHTLIKPGETKTANLVVPQGIWTLSSPIAGMEKIEIGTPHMDYFDPWDWTWNPPSYFSLNSTDADKDIEPEYVAIEFTNGTIRYGFYQPYTHDENNQIDNREFSFDIPYSSSILIGKFQNGTSAKIYYVDNATVDADVQAILSNGTSVKIDCCFNSKLFALREALRKYGYIPPSDNFTINGTFCVYLDNPSSGYFAPQEECINGVKNAVTVHQVNISYNATNIENATATVSALPLPWKGKVEVTSFNSTCYYGTDKCDYTWEISNPANHPITCILENANGQEYVIDNCTSGSGNFTCDADNGCISNEYPMKLIVRDNAYVLPIAAVGELQQPGQTVEENSTLDVNVE